MFALAGVAVLAAVPALVFGTMSGAAIPAPNSFTFCSGTDFFPSTDLNGAGPITSGLGLIGSFDPVTDNFPPTTTTSGPSFIIERETDWGLIEGSQWISWNTEGFGAGIIPVEFFVFFTVPIGATSLTLAVATLQAEQAVISLNGADEELHSGFTQGSKRTYSTTPVTGSNRLRFDVNETTGSHGFGLDYCATVTYRLASVGGTVELLGQSESPGDASESSARDYTAPLAAAVAAGALVLAAGGWYARRRWMR